MAHSYKRKRFRIVNRSLQYRFLASMLIYMTILVAFFSATVFVPELMDVGDESLSLEIRSAAADRVLSKHFWVWPGIFVLALLLGAHSFVAFQRIIGPLYRFQSAFEKIRGGDLRFAVKIREGDYLHSEAESLNGMVQVLEKRMEAIGRACHEALESLETLERGAKEKPTANWKDDEVLRLHRGSLEKLKEEVQFFRLRSPGQ